MKTLCIVGTMISAVLIMPVSPAHAGKLKAVATFSVLGDVVRQVAGDNVDLTVLVGPGGDAHEFEPTPADTVQVSRADIIFENGLFLEPWLDKIVQSSGTKALRVVVSAGIKPRTMAGNPQEADPHVWQDVTHVIVMTNNIRDALVARDPANKTTYEINARAYAQELGSLDAWVKVQVAQVPSDKRLLVTNHDALGYFAARYGFRVIGAVIPSATTEAADPSARQTAALLDLIRSSGVHAVFAENMANDRLIQTLSREAGVVVAPPLYTDALGPVNSDGSSYTGMVRHNVKVIVGALK